VSIKSQQLIECVLNLSEGRDLTKIIEVSSLIEETEGCRLLHRDIGWDAHRSVFTILGGVEDVMNAIEKIIIYSHSYFDIHKHQGVHPCVGIMDVIPFIPMQGITLKELRAIINRFSNYIASTYNISIIAYGELSSNPPLMTLAHIRKGGVLNLQKRLKKEEIKINYGPNQAHDSQGISCVTVRPIMIAFNINVRTQDISITRLIAKDLRALRKRNPRIKDVRFLAWNMEEYGNCQISMNIYDIHAISMITLMNYVREVTEKYNIELNGSEMIGMSPEFGLSHYEQSMEESIIALGLDSNKSFFKEDRILDIALGYRII
jgi:glutamate formiminotransferase